ncbi:efflux RND transporter permease subunit [Catenulispora rubra]|uniref:efflux RND transporter permease subunit n=1 Tax=Catenulispora rubra TaxID=280293 RepID=UPI00189269D4|nr:efflux RND transporter permease subunit [Catenulispora rubra]
MRWIIASSLRLAAVLTAAAAVLLVAAVAGLRHAPVDVLPEFNPPRVQVQTEALGLSVSEVEQLVTVPLEDEFNGLAFLDRIQSASLPGLSVIDLSFKPGTDVYRARQLLTERVSQGPALVAVGTPPVMIQPLSVQARATAVALSSATMPATDLSTLARWRIRPRLLAVPGVANVVLWGQRDLQLQVLVDPARMNNRGVTLNQVINTAGDAMWTSPLTFVEAASPGADGFIDNPNQRLTIQHLLPINTPADLAAVPIEDTTGRPVTLRDVATVVADHPPLRGDAVLRSGPGFLLVVEKLPGADPLKVAAGIKAAMAELAPGLRGITVDTGVFEPATYVHSALVHLGWTALAGLLLLASWFGVCWRSWRVLVIALAGTVLPVVAAAYVLYLLGATFTVLTLAGLAVALGVVVDDAVRTAEAVRVAGGEDSAAVVGSVVEVRRPLTFALAVIVLATIPILTLQDRAGALARPMMTAYLLAVAAAALVAITFVPALAHLLLRHAVSRHPAFRLRRAYDAVLSAFTTNTAVLFGTAAVLLVGCVLIVPQFGSRSLIPTMQERSLLVRWQAPAGTSLTAMEQTTATAGRSLRGLPGVTDVASDVGQALLGDRAVDVNSAQTWITLSSKADYGAAKAAVGRVLNDYPGVRHTLLTFTEASLADNRTRNGPPVRIRLYGTDPTALAATAGQLRQAVSGVRGAAGVAVQTPIMEPSIEIATNVDAAAAHGLKPGDIRRATAVLIAGIPVGSYYEQQQIFDVAVWSEPGMHGDLTAIANLPLDTPGGGQVPLRDVATVSTRPAPAEIDHDQASRYIDVTADVPGGDVRGTVDRVRSAVGDLALPVGYHVEVSSDVVVNQNTDRYTLLYAGSAAVGVFLLFQAALRSWRRAALLFCAVPPALAGGVVTAPFAGGPLTVGALAGFLAVFGVAVRAGLVVMRGIERSQVTSSSETPGSAASGADTVEMAVRRSVFPTVVTAVGSVLLFLPFAVVGDIAGMEVVRPLALVVIGGMVTTTLVMLVLLPALSLRWFHKAART